MVSLSNHAIFAAVACCVVPAPARAADLSPVAHVRPETLDARELLEEALSRSVTVRALVKRLDQSDVTVYIRFRMLASDLAGRVGILAMRPSQRYLVIELACVRPRLEQMATLGHELHHAVEIADAPAIASARTMAAHFQRIGMRATHGIGVETYETSAACDTGRRVLREVFVNPVRHADGS